MCSCGFIFSTQLWYNAALHGPNLASKILYYVDRKSPHKMSGSQSYTGAVVLFNTVSLHGITLADKLQCLVL